MTEKRKGPPRCGNTGAGSGEKRRAHHSPSYFSPEVPRIASFLLHGQENAVPLCELVRVTKLDSRTVRAMIACERKAGFPILSDNVNGYFLPADDLERVRFVRSMRHRALEILKAAAAVEKAGRAKAEGQ